MRVNIIAAVANNGVIGRNGTLPWHLPSDLSRFRDLTTGHVVVMGRKTWDSLPKRPLPSRTNIVVSRDEGWRPVDGAEVCRDLCRLLSAFGNMPTLKSEKGELFVIGGAEIYRQAMPFVDRILITRIDAEPDGDVRMPPPDINMHSAVEVSEWMVDGTTRYRHETYTRI